MKRVLARSVEGLWEIVLHCVKKWFKVVTMQRILLSGTFDHSLDAKGRVTLPARYRDYFRGGAVLVRRRPDEPCIRVYHPAAWGEYDSRFIDPLDTFENDDHSWRTRLIYMNQDFVEPDGQGRVLVPAKHIEELGLAGKVTIIGNRTHLEIWNPETLTALVQQKVGDHA